MLTEPNGKRCEVNEYIHLKHEYKKSTKMVENFREEVPEETDIWREVWNGEYEAIGRANEIPRIVVDRFRRIC